MAQQGKSGLGLEAQRENIDRFCKQEGSSRTRAKARVRYPITHGRHGMRPPLRAR